MLYYSEEETKVSTELKKLCYYHIKEGTFFSDALLTSLY